MKAYLRRQIETKHKKCEEEFKTELFEATKAQAMIDQQEKGFYSFAE
jgi:hypothetical protein